MSSQSSEPSEHPRLQQVSQDFSKFDRKRIVISLPCDGESKPFCGTAAYLLDATLGNVLQITIDDGSEVIISETDWKGLIVPDRVHGCDFSFFHPA